MIAVLSFHQRVDKPIDTLADEEKGREICSMQARRRTRVR